MTTSNFSFLQSKLPELAALGEFAEQYAYPDPASAAVKLRLFAEKLTRITCQSLNISLDAQANLFDILDDEKVKKVLPKTVLSKLHILRKFGNAAAHQNHATTQMALNCLREAYDVGAWIYLSYFDGKKSDLLPYQKLPRPASWKQERQAILQELEAKEAHIKALLQKLDEARPFTGHSGGEVAQMVAQGYQAADQLKFNEAATRQHLIDFELTRAGWKVGRKGADTAEVSQELPVKHQPTRTGSGYADYVLWDDNGKPLAVVEAKKTSVAADQGKKQAQLYADGLEKEYGRRPVIFYTNGYDIYIWDDAQNEPPRRIYGFYSKDSLQYLHFQREEKHTASDIRINYQIVDRLYQIEAIKRIVERFARKHRKGLLVQATGTGKTRVAIALCDALLKARWVKRILFLCDRRELRKQAKNAFQDYIEASLVIVSARTFKEREHRIYMATYPAMKEVYQSFDVGFFDLIIADESHRSIYNTYRDLFLYFDALQIGLTATPVSFIHRNTFQLFGCREQDPTAHFSYEDAIHSEPRYLVPFEVYKHTTKFQREGIRYANLTAEQKRELEAQLADAEDAEYDATDLDKKIFNKDTNREILRNLMENGIKDATGSHPGKTIIFARSHDHALLLEALFNEMYPQYGGKFCQVIDTYNSRAEQLIDDFKGIGSNPGLAIAISVDMLDTGIDVPEVVNLVFAKPVKSYVKFWQMIGRGTRLCPELFGPGKDKSRFRIFDHWGNFEWFDEHYQPVEPSREKSLLERLFEKRLQLADTALKTYDQETFQLAIDLIAGDIAALQAAETIAVKEKWREVLLVRDKQTLQEYRADIRQTLGNEIAPLMLWRNIRGQVPAYEFDLLMANLQLAWCQGSAEFDDFKGELQNWLLRLVPALQPVRAKSATIKALLDTAYWESVSVAGLEKVRRELRGIMHFVQKSNRQPYRAPQIDVTELREGIQHDEYLPKSTDLEMAAYRERVEAVLKELFDHNPTLQKIRRGRAVQPEEIEQLVAMVLVQHPDVDLKVLARFYPETTGRLDLAIRRVIGLAPEFIDERLTRFVQDNPSLNATQVKFMALLKNHLMRYGGIRLEKLYEPPFTLLDSEGISGIFENQRQVQQLIALIRDINRPPSRETPPG